MIIFSLSEKDNIVIRQTVYDSFHPVNDDLIVGYIQYLDVIDLIYKNSGKILRIPNDVDLLRYMFLPIAEQAFKEKILGFSGYLGLLLCSVYRNQFAYIDIENTKYFYLLEILRLFNQGSIVYSSIQVIKYSEDMGRIQITDIDKSNKDVIKETILKKSFNNKFYISEDISRIQIKNPDIKNTSRYDFINTFTIEYDNIVYDLQIFEVKKQ